MKLIPRFILLLVFVLTLSGCDIIDSIKDFSLLHPTSPESGILFYDQFDRFSSGWDRVKNEEGVTDYKDGKYLIQVDKINLDLWANPGRDFADVSIEVDASKTGGPDSNVFGIICRYQSAEEYYFGITSSDNYYAIGKMISGSQELLTGNELQLTEKMKGGSAVNHLRFDCSGSKLSLYANGYLLAQVEDQELLKGDVGLIAGSLEEAGVSISFDNFAVFTP